MVECIGVDSADFGVLLEVAHKVVNVVDLVEGRLDTFGGGVCIGGDGDDASEGSHNHVNAAVELDGAAGAERGIEHNN